MGVQSLQLSISHSFRAAKVEKRPTTTRMKRMASVPVSLSTQALFLPSLCNQKKLVASSSFTALRFSVNRKEMKKGRGFGAVCYAAPLTARNLQWIATISSAVLMVAKGTAVQKNFLVPLFALQAPASVVSWIKGDYGMWTAFLALLVRLFFFIPGELELPFIALLLVIVAPYQVMNLRGTQQGAILSLVIAAYLVFQHFSRVGSLRKAFEQGSVVATLAITCITVVSCLFLI